MIPAFPPVASSPSAGFSSISVTSWPAFARKQAVVTPTTPPPSTSVFIPRTSRVEQEPGTHRIGRIEQELARAGDKRRARDLGKNRPPALHVGFARDAPREIEP